MLKINDIIKIKISNIANGGEGIGRYNNFVIFVPFSVIDDELEVKIIEIKKSFARGKIYKILQFSKDRIQPKCKYFYNFEKNYENFCGGCNFMHLNYKNQLIYKKNLIKNSLKSFANISDEDYKFLNIYGNNEKQFYYRNKLQFPLSKNLETGEVFYGLFKNKTHNVIKINECIICKKETNLILNDFVKLATKRNLKIYDKKNFLNGFRHIFLRINENNEIIFVVVGTYDYDENNSQIKRLKEILKELFYKYNYDDELEKVKISGIIYVKNSEQKNYIFGDKFFLIFGKDKIYQTLIREENNFVKYKISLESFFQVNTFVAEKLYQSIRQKVLFVLNDLHKKPIILDLYCGIGGIGIFVGDLVEKIFGIDVLQKSIENAKISVKQNNLKNFEYLQGKINDKNILDIIYKENSNLVIVNPPRKGLEKEIIYFLNNNFSKYLIYVSCNPVTLARDLKFILEKYKILSVEAFDMFPQTSNVETLVFLLKNE